MRRITIAGAALGLTVLLGSAGMLFAQASSAPRVKNIVLVHGGFVDGSGWEAVYNALKKDGYTVAIVQNPTTSLADDVVATRRIVAAQNGPVVLVGHSYGGAVITEAGADPKVASLVYIAAFAPDKGESVSTLIKDPVPAHPCPRSCRRRTATCSSTRRSSPPPSRGTCPRKGRRSWPTPRFPGAWPP
jgi:pimeloyl-ACP methyl ester carboxylesterase